MDNKPKEGYYMKKLAVYVGRFRPFHSAHKSSIITALNENDNILVLVGSCGAPRNNKNPFAYNEIVNMIRYCFNDEDNAKIIIEPLVDYLYDDTKWISQVQSIVNKYSDGSEITLYGNNKDHSSFYLKFFPQYGFRNIENITDLHSTDIRNSFFSVDNVKGNEIMIKSKVPNEVFDFLMAFRETSEFRALQDEFIFINDYKKAWDFAPYPPIFVTCDSLVECNGHVLMIQRKHIPGKGLWAIPGGFIGEFENIEDAMLRELKEETRIDISKNMLKGCIKNEKVFSNPYRSLRGRTITHAYHLVLNLDYLPTVKADDDAMDCKWIPIANLMEMGGVIFEDHMSICTHFLKTDAIFTF